MRRALLALMAISLSVIAAGCSSSASPGTSSPLASELSYFPAGSPFLATISTDPHGPAVQNLVALLGAFPLAKLGLDALESRLSSAGISYQSEIEPLYGNPIAVGALKVSSTSRLTHSSFLAVWITKSATKLDALIKALRGLTADGSADGATLYRSGSTTVAVDGATLVLGSSRTEVTAALSRHAHGGGTTSAAFSSAMGGLPGNALVQATGSLTGALSSARAASARKVPWVAAIRGYAATLSATSTGLTARFRIDTSSGSLTTTQLPVAPGTTAPELAGSLPITVGVRDAAQTIHFLEAVEQSVDPAAYRRLATKETALKRKAGFDLNSFAALLTGSLIIESDAKTTLGRAEVSDPVRAARELAKLPLVVRDIFPTARGTRPLPGGFYAVEEAHGKTLNLGLVGNELVAGTATPAQLKAFAAAPTSPAPDAHGSIAFRISLLDLVRIVMKQAPNSLAGSVLSTLGNITGSASASPGAVTGHLSLALR